MPPVRQPALGLHPLDGDLQGHVLIAGRRELAIDTRARCEGTLKLDAEPGAELFGVGKSAPDTRAGRAQNDLFLDPVCGLMQSHGCILSRPAYEMQPKGCIPTPSSGRGRMSKPPPAIR